MLRDWVVSPALRIATWGAVAQAGLLLVSRIWLGQFVYMHGIMMMMQAPGLQTPSGWEALLQAIAPVLLSLGLLTRPVALLLLLGVIFPGVQSFLSWQDRLLLLWLIAQGAGPVSLDALLKTGLARIPISGVSGLRDLYQALGRLTADILPFGVRLCIAVAVAGGSGVASWRLPVTGEALTAPWWLLILAWALLTGSLSRVISLIMLYLIPAGLLTGMAHDGTGASLLLLMIAARGPGKLSVDWLLIGLLAKDSVGADSLPLHLPQVIVVGGGFGGIATVKALRSTACHVTLIDRRNHFLFQPLLYQVATAALSPGDIALPIRSLLRGQGNAQVRLDEVGGIDVENRKVRLSDGEIPFDFLVLATGAQHSYFGRDDWAKVAPGLKSIEDATSMRGRVLRAFEQAENADDPELRRAWLTFVVVGGGPTGVELAGALAELARTGMESEYRLIDPATARVVLVQSAARILPNFSTSSSQRAELCLRRLGVEVVKDAKVTAIDAEGVNVGSMRIDARTTFWAAGVTASPVADWLGKARDRSGRIIVGDDLSVPDLPCVFAIGDTAACHAWAGEPVPGIAPAAKQEGRYVASVIKASLGGKAAPASFRYRHAGNLATIGRLAAVVELSKLSLWGAPAWWFWGLAHVLFLAGGRNRASVVLNWLWAYVTYRRTARLIVSSSADT